MDAFGTAITTLGNNIISFIGSIINALFGAGGAWGDLLPFFLLGIMISLVLVGVKIIRKVVWGS